MSDVPTTSLQLHSTIRSDGKLELSLAEVEIPELGDGDILLRVGAAPINPSDMGLLFGPADMTTAKQEESGGRPVVTADVPERLMKTVAARVDQSMPVGNEGAGAVVKAGANDAAQAMLGRPGIEPDPSHPCLT